MNESSTKRQEAKKEGDYELVHLLLFTSFIFPHAEESQKKMHRTLISISIAIVVCAMATLPIPLNEWENQQKVFSVDHSNPEPAGLPSPSPTRSFWADSSPDANPLAREGSTGSLTSDADVCIIGSGITGVAVAYHLSEAIETNVERQSPLKVAILEARDFCA